MNKITNSFSAKKAAASTSSLYTDLDTLKCLIAICSFNTTDLDRLMKDELTLFMNSCKGIVVKQTSVVNLQQLDESNLDAFLMQLIDSDAGKERRLLLDLERTEYIALEREEVLALTGLIKKFDDAKEYILDEGRRKKFRVVFQDHEPNELTELLVGLTPNDAARARQKFYSKSKLKKCTGTEMKKVLDI